MTVYYAAEIDASLKQVCDALRQTLGPGDFTYSRNEEPCIQWALGDGLESAWLETSDTTILVSRGISRGKRVQSLASQISDFPKRANFQFVIRSPGPLAAMDECLTGLLGKRVEPYTETASIWTIDGDLELPIRHTNFTGGDFFAVFTLKLFSNLDRPGISFTSHVDFEHADYWASFIRAGIRDLAFDWLREGRPVGCIDVILTELVDHVVDMRTSAFHRAGKWALFRALVQHGVKL